MKAKNGSSHNEGIPTGRPENLPAPLLTNGEPVRSYPLPPIGAKVRVRDRGEPGLDVCGCINTAGSENNGRVGVVASYEGPNFCFVHGRLSRALQAQTKGRMVCVRFDPPSKEFLEAYVRQKENPQADALTLLFAIAAEEGKLAEMQCFWPQDLEIVE